MESGVLGGKVQLGKLPFPLAYNFRRILVCEEDDVEKALLIFRTSEILVRFLGILALCDLARLVRAGVCAPPAFGLQYRTISRPSFGTWLNLLRTSSAAAHATGQALMPELQPYLTEETSENEGPALSNLQRLDQLVNWRNSKIGHPPDPDQVLPILDQSYQHLETLLAKASFLQRYGFYYVSRVSVHKRIWHKEAQYLHDHLMLIGDNAEMLRARVSRDWYTEAPAEVIFDRRPAEGEKPGRQPYLTLRPFLLYLDKDSGKAYATVLRDLYFLNSFDTEKKKLSYSPSGNGKEFTTTDLREENEKKALLEELLAQLQPLGLPLNEPPAPEGRV